MKTQSLDTMQNWLETVNKSKLDTPEKLRIYFAVMEWFARCKKALVEDEMNKQYENKKEVSNL